MSAAHAHCCTKPSGSAGSVAASATAFFRAERQLGIGGLLIAHTPKANVEPGHERPFGSQFWWALVRSAYFVSAPPSADRRLVVGFYHRKSNLGRLHRAVGFEFGFDPGLTTILPRDIGDVQELAAQLPLWQRIRDALGSGPLTIASLAEELEAKPDTVEKAVKRAPRLFTRQTGADGVHRWALLERRSA